MNWIDLPMETTSGLAARPGGRRGVMALKLKLVRVVVAVSVLAMSVMALGAGAKLR